MRLTFIAGTDEDMKMSLILSERELKVSLLSKCRGLTLSTSRLVGFVGYHENCSPGISTGSVSVCVTVLLS